MKEDSKGNSKSDAKDLLLEDYKALSQALSESDDAKAAVLRLRGLAQPSKWWRQDTAAMASTCGTPGT